METAWMIGDGPQDVMAARNAGAVAIAVPGGIAEKEVVVAAGPHALLTSLEELPSLLSA